MAWPAFTARNPGHVDGFGAHQAVSGPLPCMERHTDASCPQTRYPQPCNASPTPLWACAFNILPFDALQVAHEAGRPIHPPDSTSLSQYFDSSKLVDSASSAHGRHLTGADAACATHSSLSQASQQRAAAGQGCMRVALPLVALVSLFPGCAAGVSEPVSCSNTVPCVFCCAVCSYGPL